MKELIVIQGATRAEAEQLMHQAAQQLDPEASITSLQLFATRRNDTFAVRPNLLCEGWDFSDLCLHLKAALADHSGITAQAWLQLPGDTMNGLPAHQMLCIGFDRPSPDELTITDPDGTGYEFILYTDEESGEEFVMAEPARATTTPVPNSSCSLSATSPWANDARSNASAAYTRRCGKVTPSG